MDSSFEVSATQMQANSHVGRFSREAVVIELDIAIQDLIGINAFLLQSVYHRGSAEIREEWIIHLNIPAPGLVQICNLLTVCLGDIGEITLVAGIRVFGVCEWPMTEMEPFRCTLHVKTTPQRLTIVIFIYLTSSA